MMEELRLAPQATGPDPRAAGQIRQPRAPPGYQNVGGILAPGDGSNGEARREIGRDILHAVDREIHLAGQQRLFDLLDEERLAADLRQRDVQDLVPHRPDALQSERDGRKGRPQPRRNVLRLPHREPRPACPDDEWSQVGLSESRLAARGSPRFILGSRLSALGSQCHRSFSSRPNSRRRIVE